MKRILCALVLIVLTANGARGWDPPRWNSRLTVGIGTIVWSPGGEDKDLFQTSMGVNLNVQYWFQPRTTLLLSASYATLNAREDIWYEILGLDQTFDEWNVEGKLWQGSLELRRLYPAGLRNYMYLGVGADVFFFDTIKGEYAIYIPGEPIYDTIKENRDPSLTFGPHLSPGMFFLFHSFLGEMFIDVGVRFHYLVDGDADNPFWLDPFFTTGLRIF